MFDENDEMSSTVSDTNNTQLLSRLLSKAGNSRTITRDAMGEYIAGTGKPPLTQLAIPLPGAADYSPGTTLTKPSPAQYSIVGKPKVSRNNNFPGPNNYKTDTDMVWRDRGFPMIGKGTGTPHHSTCSLGPAAYEVKYNGFGTGDHGASLKGRPAIGHGPPDTLVQPVDTHYNKYDAGPATYRPRSAHWGNNIEKSFGLALNKVPKQVPGPAEYDIRGEKKVRGPAYSLAKRLPHMTRMANNNPGPGSYDIGTTIGKSVAKSLTSRNKEQENAWVPAANTYVIPSTLGSGDPTSMTYRAFEKRIESHPGPGEYSVDPVCNLNKAPAYSFRLNLIPGYPEVMNFGKYDLMHNSVVGPGRYDHKKEASKNDAPSYSMGKMLQPAPEETPGPASYRIENPVRPDGKRAPAFLMGTRVDKRKVTAGPGPAAYYPTKGSGQSKSMSSRNNHHKAQRTPAANAYTIKSGQTKNGLLKGPQASLKGRPSPYMYSGIRNTIFS